MVSHTTVRKYLDLLSGGFVVEQLRPWAENVGKRVVRSPKVYVGHAGEQTYPLSKGVRAVAAARLSTDLTALRR